MDEETKWWRVIDPLNPLYGCDVRLSDVDGIYGGKITSPLIWWKVVAMRRVDMVVGDRPFQLMAPDGCDLGIAIDPEQLTTSPIQEDVIEFDRGSPYGEFIQERSHRIHDDGPSLTVVRFTRALQAVLIDVDGNCMASNTFFADHDELAQLELTLVGLLNDIDALVTLLKSGGEIAATEA